MTTTSASAALEHDIGETGLFAVRLDSSDIRIRAVAGPAVRVFDPTGRLEGTVVVERATGSLSLRADRGVGIGTGSPSVRTGRRVPDLEIEVPRLATVVIETASGDVAVDGLEGDQRYRTASGELTLRDVQGRVILDAVSGGVQLGMAGACVVTARTVSGDLALRGDAIESLLLSTTSGDVRLDGRLAGQGPFSIETVSGDAVLGVSGSLTVSLKSVTGDLRSEVDAISDGGRGSRTLVVGQGGPSLAIRSISGDVRVVRPSTVSAPLQPPVPPMAPLPPGASFAPPTPPPARPTSPELEGSTAMDQNELHPAPDLPSGDPSLPILYALERGEIDVEEASRRLAALDGAGPTDETLRTETPA